MTFLHKLAQRLARLWIPPVIGIFLMTTCKLPPARSTAPPDAVARLDLSPSSLTLLTDRTTDFVVVALTATNDTVDVSLNWTTNGGSISPMSDLRGVQYARYRAPTQPGSYKVVARTTSGGIADSAVVGVSAVPVASVSVSPGSASATIGQAVQLTAILLDSAGSALSGRTVTWVSSNSGIATVSPSGLVTGVAAGSATMTAISEAKSGTSVVTVTPVQVASVSVSPASVSMTIGQTAQLTATPLDANGNVLTGRVVTWGSSSTGVAIVNGSGLVTSVAAGLAMITATSEGKSGAAAVTTTVTPAPVASVSVSPASASVTAGQTVQLTATPRDASGNALSGRVVTWGSSNPPASTVNGSGLVTGVAVGSATITATSEGQGGSAAVTVSASIPPPPPSPTEPVFQSGVNTSLYYDNWTSYSNVSQLWNGGGLNQYLISSGTNLVTSFATGGIDGPQVLDFDYTGSSGSPILESNAVGGVAPNNTAVGPDVIVITWYYKNVGAQLYMGKLWATHSSGPDNQNRYMLEHTRLTGAYQDDRTIGYSCFWNANGDAIASAAPTGTNGPGWYHDDVTAANRTGALFTQNINYGSGAGQWNATKLQDGQWHRYTTRFSKGANWQARGIGYQRVEMWADGVKIMEYLGDDPTRCEYGKIWGMQPDTKMVNVHQIGGPNSIPDGVRAVHTQRDGLRIWTP